MNRRIIAAILMSAVFGCTRSDSPVVARNAWYEFGEGAPVNLKPGHIFCEAQLIRHPHIGFATYTVAERNWSREDESIAIHKAVDRIRKEFSKSFQEHIINAWQNKRVAVAKGLHPRDEGAVPFDLREVVILIRDVGERQQADRIRVGYLFSAETLFDESIPAEAAIAGAFRDSNALHYDRSQPAPSDQVIYDIIDRFHKAEAISGDGEHRNGDAHHATE